MESYLLPQYTNSEEFMDRYFESLYEVNSPISRTANRVGVKFADKSELSSDCLDYFIDNKHQLEEEFFEELSAKIGENKTSLFCKIIAKYWYDGHYKRNSKLVNGIKKNIHDYLSCLKNTDDLSDVVVNSKIKPYKEIFTKEDISIILTINYHNVWKHLELWLDSHPNSREFTRSSIYFRRGVPRDSLYKEKLKYKEWDYINSYSIAFSIPEQFSQMVKGKIPIIINGDSVFFQERILFFSPFIQGMDAGQLELGIIPGKYAEKLEYQGNHGGIHEYIIEYENRNEFLPPY